MRFLPTMDPERRIIAVTLLVPYDGLSVTISEICRKYNVASSAVYKWRDKFIAGGTAAMEHGRSTVESSLTREINELKGIIGELTIANETLKKIQITRRGEKP